MKLLAKDVLAKGALFRFRAKGNSMLPLIRDDDILTLAPCNKTNIAIGVVAAFINPLSGLLTIHRAVRKDGGKVLFQGDALVEPDGWIDQRDCIGYLVRVERAGKDIKFGLGVERRIIALCRTNNYLWLFLRGVYQIGGRFFLKKFHGG